ncbi:MAG: hypothetical protein MJZ38_05955 [archaeon]|nr:hypothetical protein [archaeon]
MSLVMPLLVRRLRNDLQELEDDFGLSAEPIPDNIMLPLCIPLHVSNVPAYSGPDVAVNDHSFSLIIGEDYPYERPKVKWSSPIFHPNIMAPSEGGVVCVMDMDHWSADSTLSTLVRSLIDLLKHPNPHDPLRSSTCEEAAEWFLNKM